MIVRKADEDAPLWSLSPAVTQRNEASVRGSKSVPGMCDRGRWPPFRTLPVYYYLEVADKVDGLSVLGLVVCVGSSRLE